MASTIILSDNGASSGSAGLKQTAGNDGVLILQTTTSGGTATNAIYVDTSQNVGLGVTPSAFSGGKAIEIGAAGNAFNGYEASNILVSSGAYYNGGWKYANSSYGASLYQQYRGTHNWQIAASGTAGNAITFTQAMTLNASSNLQLGTTTVSAARLNVFSSDVNKQIVFSNNETYYGSVAHNAATGMNEYRTEATGGHAFFKGTESTAGMTFDSSGRLLVGTTSALNSTANLSVFNTSGGSSGGLSIGYGSGAAANRWIYLISANGSLYFESSANAASLNSAGAWTNASDARLKNSITDIKYGLSAVLSAQPRSYKMNDLEGDYIGFVAQELQTVIPEVVSGDPEKQLGVDYGSLVAVAFKAIQELKAELDTAKEQIAILQGVQQ